jgi:hypothetical protein
MSTLWWKARPAASLLSPTTGDALLRDSTAAPPAGTAPGVYSR